MVYLNAGFFKPMVILIGVIFLPINIACNLLYCFDHRTELLIVSTVLFLLFVATVIGVHKHSKSKRYFLSVNDNSVTIKYPNVCSDMQELVLNCTQIIKIEYYRLSSIRGWCLLVNYVLPQCVYMTYMQEGKECRKLIGYADYHQMRDVCHMMNITFVLK